MVSPDTLLARAHGYRVVVVGVLRGLIGRHGRNLVLLEMAVAVAGFPGLVESHLVAGAGQSGVGGRAHLAAHGLAGLLL